MRWALVVGSLGLAGCLATPPSGLAGDPDGGTTDEGDGAPPGGGTLVLTGLAARDPLTLDMRDELVLMGRRDDEPVALILFPGPSRLESVTMLEVPLPFEPIDLTVSRWGAATGLAIALGPDGKLAGIQKDGTITDIVLTDGGEPTTPRIEQLSELNIDGRRLTLADGDEIYVTDPLQGGQPGEQPIEIYPLQVAAEPILVDSAYAGGAAGAIGVVEDDSEIDVYEVTVTEEPELGPDQVVGDVIPAGLSRASWQLSVSDIMVLTGIDPAGPRLWFHSTSLSESEVTSGTALDGQLEVFHDLVITRMDASIAELAVLAEVGGQLDVLVFKDPAATPDALPDAMVLPVSGFTGPVWMQAMDAAFDLGDPGQNELIVYDGAGHLACVDLVEDLLVSCGNLDLADLVKAPGASTSGRTGW
jgi:hypothetical protein